jgi:hypothetical protein
MPAECPPYSAYRSQRREASTGLDEGRVTESPAKTAPSVWSDERQLRQPEFGGVPGGHVFKLATETSCVQRVFSSDARNVPSTFCMSCRALATRQNRLD